MKANDLELLESVWQQWQLKQHSDKIGYTDDIGEALVYAGKEGFIDILKWLLEHGVHSNCTDVFGNTAIIVAAEKGHVNVVETLIEYECQVERYTFLVIMSGLNYYGTYNLFDLAKFNFNTESTVFKMRV